MNNQLKEVEIFINKVIKERANEFSYKYKDFPNWSLIMAEYDLIIFTADHKKIEIEIDEENEVDLNNVWAYIDFFFRYYENTTCFDMCLENISENLADLNESLIQVKNNELDSITHALNEINEIEKYLKDLKESLLYMKEN